MARVPAAVIRRTRPAQLPPLLRAIVVGDQRLAARLIAMSRTSVTVRSPGWAWLPRYKTGYTTGDTALHLAAGVANVAAVRLLLRRGADPDAANVHGHRPLHAAVSCGSGRPPIRQRRVARIVALLIKGGAHPDARDIRGVAPLHTAVRARSLESVRALLDGGAALRPRNGATGATPLHLAVRTTGKGGSGAPAARAAASAITALLVARGARFTDRDRRGRSVTDWAGTTRV